MFGAIIGDIVGSRFEFNNYKGKDFKFFDKECSITDDSVMTIALAKALLESKNTDEVSDNAVKWMRYFGKKYINAGYGGRFLHWLIDKDPKPYYSWGNGSAMRVSAVGYVAETALEVIELSRKVTEVTHNHPEGIKGAEATAMAIYMARNGYSKEEMYKIMSEYYFIGFKLDDIRASYAFKVSCQGTMPPALLAFFESTNFEDAVRNAISIGGDSDTIGAITGSIAEAYYGIPKDIRIAASKYIPKDLLEIVNEFELKYPSKIL